MVSDIFILREPPPDLPAERGRLLACVRSAAPWAEVLEVGSTTIEGLIGKQDLDLLVRVARTDFDRTRTRLDEEFARDEQQLSNELYQGYRVPGGLDAALQLTVAGCEYDRFTHFLDALREDPALVSAYNALKRRWHGKSMDDYRVEKASFIRSVLEGRRPT